MPNAGLVLTGGGARAAYQVGVLRAVAELTQQKESPFRVIAGVSAGAINGTALASFSHDFDEGIQRLTQTWATLKVDDVFSTQYHSLVMIALRLLRDIIFGGMITHRPFNYLLDTDPLRKLLDRTIRFDKIHENIQSGCLRGLAVTATNYRSGTSIAFYDGDQAIQPWIRSYRFSERSRITANHVMASAAMPVFFPPQKLENNFYGDGSIRLSSPLSAAIHLGADRILAIGVRHPRTTESVIKLHQEKTEKISLAEITGVLLNSIFLDSLDSDLERMERINRTLRLLKAAGQAPSSSPDGLREIPVMVIQPSRDLGAMAGKQFDQFPKILQYLLRGFGARRNKGFDLISYLAFDGAYTRQLMELGYNDAWARKDALAEFLS